jgi:ABC-type glycerol-3-phosphate transport system substrate-binding protein
MRKRNIITLAVLAILLISGGIYFSFTNKTPLPNYTSKTIEEPLVENKYSTYLINNLNNRVRDDISFYHVISPTSFILPSGDSLVNDVYSNKGLVYRFDKDRTISFNVNVENEGLYEIALNYYAIPMSYSPMEIDIRINGASPFIEATQIKLDPYWVNIETEDNVDRYGNDIAYSQEQITFWTKMSLKDSTRLHSEPLKFHLVKGNNIVSITKLDGAFFLGEIEISNKKELISYQDYVNMNNNNATSKYNQKYEAEHFYYKNDATIQAGTNTDPSVTPFSVSYIKLNVMGADSYNESGQSVSYKIEVPTSGYYYLTFKVLQNDKYTTSYRTLYVNGKIPFKEAAHLPFAYSPSWQNVTLHGLNGEPYAIYFDKDQENIITLAVDGSLTRPISEHLYKLTSEINALGLDIKAVTGNNVDANIDWDMKEFFPTIDEDILGWINTINDIIDYSKSIYGYKEDSYQINDYRVAISKLRTLYNDINQIPKRLSLLSEGSSSAAQLLANRISNVTNQPLIVDSFVVHSSDYKVKNVNVTWYNKLGVSIQRFFNSFFSNDRYASSKDDEVEIWVNRSRQYVDLMQKLADEQFTKETGIKVKMSIMQDEGKLLLANSANKQPDIALSVSSWIPQDYGTRGAILELNNLEGFSEVMSYYKDEQLIPLTYNNQLYGLPETENFFVLYYRKDTLNKLGLDVPDTWDDVLKMLPILKRYGMNFYIPLSNSSSLKSFDTTAPFIYQFNGKIYSDDGTSAAIDDENTIKALTFMTNLYKEYSLPYQVSNFFNEFRYNKIPIGISDIGTYLQLLNAAPEISGLWDIAVVPGIKDENGNVNRSMGGTQSSSMIFKKSTKQDEAWQFLKWWMSTPTQVEFASRLTNTYGKKYLWNSANMEAFKLLNWKTEHKLTILAQWEHLKEVPKIPGSYIVERELSNIYNDVVFNDYNLRSRVSDALITMNKEIKRKMIEFEYLSKSGQVLKQFILPSSSEIRKWRDE